MHTASVDVKARSLESASPVAASNSNKLPEELLAAGAGDAAPAAGAAPAAPIAAPAAPATGAVLPAASPPVAIAEPPAAGAGKPFTWHMPWPEQPLVLVPIGQAA